MLFTYPVAGAPDKVIALLVGMVLFVVNEANRVENQVIMKPTLSREKCVCLQNLNKILCVLDNKSQSDIYRQSVQKEFKRFFIFGF